MTEGPIDLVVLTFAGPGFGSRIAEGLQEFVANETIRVTDVLFVHKNDAGAVDVKELTELSPADQKPWRPISTSIDEILSNGDAQEVATLIPKNSTAVLLVVEEAWAGSLRQRMQDADVQTAVMQRVPRALIGSALRAVPASVELPKADDRTHNVA